MNSVRLIRLCFLTFIYSLHSNMIISSTLFIYNALGWYLIAKTGHQGRRKARRRKARRRKACEYSLFQPYA